MGFAGHGAATALARAVGTLAARVQREANVLAYIDGFLAVLLAGDGGAVSLWR